MLKQILQSLRNKSVSNSTTAQEAVAAESIAPTGKSYSLQSGERQTAPSIEGIRMDHLCRYQLINDHLMRAESKASINGLDIFCGNGYGTFLLAKSNPSAHVIGVDGSAEAIAQANENYTLTNNLFAHKLFPFMLPKQAFDFIACFESLEHVEADEAMFSAMVAAVKPGGLIFVSAPNQKYHDLQKNPHIFHFRHYLHDEFLACFQGNLELQSWYGQDVYEFNADRINTFKLLKTSAMLPKENIQGQVNIYVFRKPEK